MKKIKSIMLMLGLIAWTIACDRELESEGIATGVIRFPSIEVQGENPVVISSGSDFTDPGAKAFLGTDDITDQLTTEDHVDVNTPGVYSVDYSVATTNELDQQSVATASRTVSVTDGDVCSIDLAGSYKRNPDLGVTVNVTRFKCGVFDLDNVLARTTFVSGVRMYPIGNDELVIPTTNSPFGRIEGTGEITANGFTITMSFLDPPNAGLVLTRVYVKQ